MPILNESLAFDREPSHVRDAFVGKSARRVLLPAGLALYKFTGFEVTPNRAGANYSPWWAAVDPLVAEDPGLDGHIAGAKAAGLSMVAYAREKFAVMYQWNALGVPQSGFAKVARIRLREPAYGFGGLCQRKWEMHPMNREVQKHVIGGVNPRLSPLRAPIFAGGAYQYYIPNLTSAQVQSTGVSLIP